MSKQDFEDDLDAVFGERRAEFAPKLKEMLYQLWREGRKRGASHERGVQADQVLGMRAKNKAPSDKFKSPLNRMEEVYRTTNEWVTIDSLPTNTPIQGQAADAPRAQSHRETFSQILAGKEDVIQAPMTVKKERDYLGRKKDSFGQEFFGEIATTATKELFGTFPVKTRKTKLKK